MYVIFTGKTGMAEENLLEWNKKSAGALLINVQTGVLLTR